MIGNMLINIYYKINSLNFFYLIIIIKGLCASNILFCGTFLFYLEETRYDIQNNFLFFSIGIFISFIIISIKY